MKEKLKNSDLKRLTLEEYKTAKKLKISIVLDNVRSRHNIGSVFRTSDAFRIEKIYLCGICSTPPNAEIHKSALGAENSVEWAYFEKTENAVNELIAGGYKIIAIEQVKQSIMLNDFSFSENEKYAFIFGNEVKGVSQNIVDISDFCIEIPQEGTKHSLNVSVSVGIVLWDIFKVHSKNRVKS